MHVCERLCPAYMTPLAVSEKQKATAFQSQNDMFSPLFLHWGLLR
jgi:hypothetical protein